MAKYDTFVLGYAKESAYGSSAITGASSTAYKLGIINDDVQLPEPEVELIPIRGDTSLYDPDDYIKSRFKLQSTIAVIPTDGVLLYYILGSTSTAGASAPYTHTITRVTGGGEIPSLTLHQEFKDSSSSLTNFSLNYVGTKITSAEIICDPAGPLEGILYYQLTLMAKDCARGTIILDSSHQPSWHSSDHITPFKWNQMTCTYNGSNIEDELDNVKLTITLPHIYLYTPRVETTDKTHIPYLCPATGPGLILLEFRKQLKNYTFIDEALTSTSTGADIVLKFTRSANDYIQFTLTNGHAYKPVLQHPAATKYAAENHLIRFEEVEVEVKDNIESTLYGG